MVRNPPHRPRQRPVGEMVIALVEGTSATVKRYLLERKLGAGGMATVYLARDVKHERPVAIKVLTSGRTPT